MAAEALRQALRLLWAHKTRSLLTLFGLVWGTASVILLVGWGEGMSTMFESAFEKTGRNMGQVWAGKVSEEFTPAADRRWLWFSDEDVERLRRRARLVDAVGSEAWEMLPVAHSGRMAQADVRGIDPEVLAIRGVGIDAGRGITRADVGQRRRVVLLGAAIRRRVLGAHGRLGSYVRIGGQPFQVVGFLEDIGVQLGSDRTLIEEQVWIPVTTLQTLWPKPWTDDAVVDRILYRMPHRNLLDDAEVEVRAILAEGLGVAADDDEAVGIWSNLEMVRDLPLDATKVVFAILASATLIIGGIGTLTLMLDSVHERRPEIGVRLAVGARRRDVVAQFFLESVAVTGLGGLSGLALGVGSCALLGQLHVPDLIPVPELHAGTVALALGVLSAVGIASGVIPAWRAARVDPAQSLRME